MNDQFVGAQETLQQPIYSVLIIFLLGNEKCCIHNFLQLYTSYEKMQ